MTPNTTNGSDQTVNLNNNGTATTPVSGAGATPPPTATQSSNIGSVPEAEPVGVRDSSEPVSDIFATVDPIKEEPEPVTPPLSEPKPINMGTMASGEPALNPAFESVKPKRRWLKVLIPVVVVLAAAIGGVVWYLNTMVTSADALKSFSSSTSGISSELSELASKVSDNPSSESASVLAEDDMKGFDEALVNFEKATSNLKDDKKALKQAALNYSAALKEYRNDAIILALESRKVAAIVYKISFIGGFASSYDATGYQTYVDKHITELKTYKQELVDLDLKNEKAKAYRDASSELVDGLSEALAKVKAAYASGDQATVVSVKGSLLSVLLDSSVVTKEEEISDILSISSDVFKKVESARNALNAEIAKVNSN